MELTRIGYASFVTRSVYDLKARLKKLGSDLSIWAGQPDVVLAKLVEAFQRGGDKVEAVWMSGEVRSARLSAAIKREERN